VAGIKPWERQTGESSKAYEAFKVYLELGSDRSLQRASEVLSKSVPLMKRWGAQWNWVERARAWDSMPSLKTEEAYEDMARKIAAQHSRLATKLADRLEKNLDMLPEGADPSMRFSTAMGAARQSHQFAAELSKPKDTKAEAINEAIVNLLQKLGADE